MPGPPHPRVSLSAYVDDRLPPWRRAVLEQHLAGCTRCALEVARIQSLRDLLGASDSPELPPGLRERLLDVGAADDAPLHDARSYVARSDVARSDVARSDAAASVPPSRAGGSANRPRPLVGAVGVVAAGLVVLGAAALGAVVTGATTAVPGTAPRASLTTVLPALLTWPDDPDAAATGRPVDNGDRP